MSPGLQAGFHAHALITHAPGFDIAADNCLSVLIGNECHGFTALPGECGNGHNHGWRVLRHPECHRRRHADAHFWHGLRNGDAHGIGSRSRIGGSGDFTDFPFALDVRCGPKRD